jgi:hypothetical protein
MDRKNIPIVPDENRMEGLLASIQPVPSEQFHQKMKQAAWLSEGKQIPPRNLKRKLAIALTVLVLLGSLFVTPQGRVWAQEAFHFFVRINSETAEVPESTRKWLQDINANAPYDTPLVPVFIPTVSPEVAALPGCETSQESYACQVAKAESKLGFDLKELPQAPEGWKFNSVTFMIRSKSASINYLLDFSSTSYGTFNLTQGQGRGPWYDPKDPWSLVPEDKVKKVKVGNHEAEYVNGSFSLYTGSKNLTWDDLDGHQRLAWSDGTRWYLLEIWPNLNLPDRIGRDQLIEMAESLVDTPTEAANALDPDYLYSVSDAETISGLDLKAPTLLPMETSFSYARYFPDSRQVRLFYGVNDELVIYEQKARSEDFSTRKGYKIVKVNGRNAFYSVDKEGGDPHQFLWWEADGISYQMHFYQYFEKIDQEQMIAIAESMQDVNDFRSKESRPYEYVSIYAKALGVDALEFPETPAGWSYTTVFGNPDGRCIFMIYNSSAGPGSLQLQQCAIDKYFSVADIPSSMAQQVKIGNHQGIYAEGSFITQDSGQLLWNPDPTQKQLYWQENGLWIDMTLSGALHNKEDFISYAESLR